MIHLLHLPYCCVGVNYYARIDYSTLQLIIPLSMGADAYAYAYALLLAATFAVHGCLLYCVV